MTDRQKLFGVFLCSAGIFLCGFSAGKVNTKIKIAKEFSSQESLLKNAFNDLAGQVMNGTKTRDEIEEYFEEQLNFVKIVTNL